MIKELEENRRSSPFISSKIGTYCFIYLICKTLKQEKTHVLDISRLISNLDASDVEKEILSRHIINFPVLNELKIILNHFVYIICADMTQCIRKRTCVI